MVNLSFYGGVGEIGGNKILLEDSGRKLLLDFGFPYGRHKLFYEEFLKPRGGAGLLDPLVMGLLPPLRGIYREDYDLPEVWRELREDPLYRVVEGMDSVLLSHAHLDHSAHISFLKQEISVYSTAMTAFLTKAIQDSGKSDFDQQVCYYNPTCRACPQGWRQESHIAEGDGKRQRRFKFRNEELLSLSAEAMGFWMEGFWEKGAKQKGVATIAPGGHNECSFNLRCFPVDHSIPGACAWAIETGAGWIVYSGDLRLHGKRRGLTEKFIADAAALRPKALIIEGTNIDKQTNTPESSVYEKGLSAIKRNRGLVIADFSARDIDRLLTFLEIAKQVKRKLVILAKDAYMLRTARLLDKDVPDIAADKDILIYQETTAARYPQTWQRNLFNDYSDRIVLAEDVKKNSGDFIVCFSFFDLNELPSIGRGSEGLYVYSSSEPHDEEQQIDMTRLHNWMDHFGMRGMGLPVEKDGQWQIPEDEKGLHASGHACGSDLLRISREINPETVIPVHSTKPALYAEGLKNTGIKVLLPMQGGTLNI